MNNKVESAFYKTIMEGVAKYVKKNTPTYTTAKVVSIDDDGTPYVQFPGAETTTPVTTVTNAAKGDEVLVQVNSNGDAYVYGNLTDQPVSKVEVDKITENTTNVLEKFDYSIQEIIDKLNLEDYVKIGESNVPILSNILKLENNILDIQNGEEGLVHLRVTTEGLELGNYSEQYGLNNYVFFSKDGFGRIGPLQTGVNYGQFSLSVGLGRATGQYSLAAGPSATASQVGAFAHGTATASGYLSFAANVSTATGAISSSFGSSTASGDYSFSEGSGTNANGHAVHAEGINTNAYGSATHVEGESNTVYGSGVHGEGRGNTVYNGGDSDHIEGIHNSLTPYGAGSGRPNHIEGQDNTATGAEHLHIEGYGHSITGSSAVHVEGWANTNLQNLSYSHIEGQTNRASGSSVIHVEGLTNNITNSSQTHVEGLNNTVSSSNNSHIEGLGNTVSNSSETHVEGLNNNVIASSSFVGGCGNVVSGTEEYEYRFGGDGSTNSFNIGTDWLEILSVKIDNVEIERYGYPISYSINDSRYIVFYNSVDPDNSAPVDESLIKVNVLKTGISRDGIFIHALNGVARYSHQSIFGYYNDNKSDTLLEIGNGRSASSSWRGNAFEVTNDGYIRTGVGSEKIAFGKNQSDVYGYYKGDGTFVPWITQDTTYTAGANIDITNNVISAPNVAPIVNGKVPEQYLPSYVDDVIEGYYYNGSFYEDDQHQELITPERGKIYISLDTDKSYRWSGTVYVELTSGGVVYTAGDGIDISSTNEISVSDDIARTADIPTVPTNVSAFTNDVGYLTQHQDLSNYIQKSLTAGLVKNDGTIDTTAYAAVSALDGYLPLAGGTMAGAINSQNIIPATDDSYRLGSSSSKYNSAYIKRIYSLASIESTTDGSKRLLVPAKSGTIAVNEDLPEVVGNLIAVNPILESGTLIANITINGDSKNIYAPTPPSKTSDLANDIGFITAYDIPPIPDELADLSDDSTHRLVTDTEKSTWNGKSDFSGSYNDLSDKPTIPAAQVNSDWNASSGVAKILNKPTLATVATTGSYSDLSNKPTIPSVGNGTLTIQKNGTNVQTFTANQSGSVTANIVVPFDYNATTVGSGDQGFTGAPHYGVFSDGSSVGALIGDDGVYMFLPYQTNSNSYGFVLACNDDGNQFYLGSLTGVSDGSINWSRIYHDNYHPLAGKADFIKFPRNAVNYDTAMRSRSGETVAFDELGGTTGHPSFISTFTNPWFNLITMHSPDTNYGSQLAIPMTGFTAPAWRYFAGNNFGSWEYIPSSDALSVGNSSTPVYLEDGKLKTISSGYLPLSGGTMNAGARITFTNSASEDGVYLNNGSYQLRLIIGSGGVNRGLWDGSRWMIYENASDVLLNSPGSLILNNNTVINHTEGSWVSGLRINSVANNANGSAHITFGGQSGTTTGVSSSYPMYQVGKISDISGGFAIRAAYNGTYHDVFKASPTTGLTQLLSYANGTTVNITAKESDIDLTATPLTTSKITLKTNNLLFAGTETSGSITRGGTGVSSWPFKFTGYESGQVPVSTTIMTGVTINDGELVLLFLSSGAGNTFYAARLLRNNNGSLQSTNLATTGTSHATVTMKAANVIMIQNTSSSYKLNYKILRLG